MDKDAVVAKIKETGIIPVIRAESADIAQRAVDAIREGGISILEITMTVPGAIRIIETLAHRCGSDAVVGAGTVLDGETARSCVLAGALFVVSPVLDIDTIACCHRYSVVAMPGALTPTEVLRAWSAGAEFVKVFPAGAVGGASYIKALKAPLPQVQLVPTGGVSLKTAPDFIKAGASGFGVGADLVDVATLREGNGQLISSRARQYVEAVREARNLALRVAN